MDPPQFDLSPYSFVAIPLFIVTAAVACYAWRIKEKSAALWWAIAALTSIPLGMASLFFNSMIPQGIALLPLTDAFAILSMAASIKFAYGFPEPDRSVEARLVEVFAGCVSLFSLGYSLYFVYQALAHQLYTLQVLPVYWLLNPLAFFTALIVLVRRTIALQRSTTGSDGWRTIWLAFCQPQGRSTRALRNYSLALSTGLIQGVASGLGALDVIKPPVDAYAIGFSMLVMVVAITYTVFEISPQHPNLVVRLTGISLVTLLVILGAVGLSDVQLATEQVDQQRVAEVKSIRRSIQSIDPTALPISPAYVIAWPRDRTGQLPDDLQEYHLLYARSPDFDPRALLEERKLHLRGELPLKGSWGGYYVEEVLYVANRSIPVQLRYGKHPLGSYHQYAGYIVVEGDYEYEIGFSLAEMSQAVLADSKGMVYAMVLGSVFILLVFPLFFRSNLMQPLNQLLEGVRQADAGDLNISVPIRRDDEIGFLTDAFNKMAASLRSSEKRLRQERDFAAALAESTAVLTATLDLDQVLDHILDQVSRIVPNEAVSIMLIDGEIAHPVRWRGYAQYGFDEKKITSLRFKVGELPNLRQMIEKRKPIAIADTLAYADWFDQPGLEWVRSYAGAPIIVHDEVIGFLNVGSSQCGFYTREYAQALQAFAGYAAAAIENARLYESVQRELAERRRAEAVVQELNISLERRITDRTRELAVLYDVTDIASRMENIQDLMKAILARTMDTLWSDVGVIYLLGGDGRALDADDLRLAAHAGFHQAGLELSLESLPAVKDVFAKVLAQREPVLIPELAVEAAPERDSGAKTLIVAPLQAEGQVWGIIGLMRSAQRGYTLEEIALLTSIADQVGGALQRDRLRRLAEKMALLQERQRLARDLHDSVTQSLYGLVTLTEAGQGQVEQGAWDSVGRTFAQMGETARRAIKEMRLFIHQLRSPLLEEEGLVGALQQRLAAVEGHSDVQARLMVSTDDIQLPLFMQEALYQIAQEALNNTLRHANAASVTVHLLQERDSVVMEIVDDGCGFDLAQVGKGGMGLENMRARAEEIGAQFEIISSPGEGVLVRATMHCEGRLNE